MTDSVMLTISGRDITRPLDILLVSKSLSLSLSLSRKLHAKYLWFKERALCSLTYKYDNPGRLIQQFRNHEQGRTDNYTEYDI
jgi:hypothetical protein